MTDGPMAASSSSDAGSAVSRMSVPGPEQQVLRERVGDWDVVATLWPAPGAPGVVTRGLVARRQMIGQYLQETITPAPDSDVPHFTRLDYLDFDRVEGRWKYVSMDTRLPVSIMPAASVAPTVHGTITLQFQPQGFVGFGVEVEGRFMLSDMVVSYPDLDVDRKQQHVLMATGGGSPWLFVQYEYTRRR